MGLGLHGGGAAAARFFASHGAEVTVTDMKKCGDLAAGIEALSDLKIRFVLGRHEQEDFSSADMVIKNPAVPRDSSYLAAAKRVETDISIFLRLSKRPLIAVTGSKGKSTTASALAHVLEAVFPKTKLGGNITVSPLTFVESCMEAAEDPVVLELSSWQLADIPEISLLKPRVAVFTNLLHDHQDRYPDLETYAADKKRIFASQSAEDAAVCGFDDPFGRRFAVSAAAAPYFFSRKPFAELFDGGFLEKEIGYVRMNGLEESCLPKETALRGEHNKLNLLAAAVALRIFKVNPRSISSGLANFPGIPHRMEVVKTVNGVRWYNDSAATIPEACAAAIRSFQDSVHLIVGGTDKNLDFSSLKEVFRIPKSIHLLEGSATDKLRYLLDEEKVFYYGPFSRLCDAVESARNSAHPGSAVLFSPASTSFGMFLNEFDRGNRFKALIEEL